MRREADKRSPESLARFHEIVEDELRLSLAERGEPLYRMMEYQLGWIDEHGEPRASPETPRVLSGLCLSLCEALGGPVAAAAPAAAAMELISLFSQVHDDIQDGRPTRGGHPSVWWVWGPAQAINAGDGLHALARLSLFRMAERGAPLDAVLEATRTLDRACLEMFEGQHIALRFQEQVAVTREAYMRMVDRRAGALPGCAAELAALVAGADAPVREACALAGHRIGAATWIRADIDALWGRDPGDEHTGVLAAARGGGPTSSALTRQLRTGSMTAEKDFRTSAAARQQGAETLTDRESEGQHTYTHTAELHITPLLQQL